MVLYAKDIMKNYTKTFPADTNALDGAKIMQQDHVGFLIVHDSGGKPVGIVTEWDYISKVVAAEKDPRKVTLSQIMKEGIISVEAETPTEKVTVIMGKNLIRRTPARARRGRRGGEREAVVPHPVCPKGWTGHRDGPLAPQGCLSTHSTHG